MNLKTNISNMVLKIGFGVGLATTLVACNTQRFSSLPEEPAQVENLAPSRISEEFSQGSQASPVDMLIVTDNSRSMAEEQSKMADRTHSLLDKMQSLDWRIGFTTTDVSSGTYGLKGALLPLEGGVGNVLKKGDANAERIFARTITRDETLNCLLAEDCPTGNEQPLAATLLALQKKATTNKNFFRDNADLMVLIISDEDEKSNGVGALLGNALVLGIRSILSPDQKFVVSAIIIKPGDSSCHSSQQPDGNYGNVISGLVLLTGGFLGSVCATDYGSQLASIGELVRRAADSFTLSQTPKVGTLNLSFVPAQPTTQWKLIGRQVIFTKNAPPIGTKIKASYEQ